VIDGQLLNVGGFARDGELVVAVPYSTEQSPNDPAGPSVRIRTLRRPDLVAAVAAYVRETHYTGAICVDFIQDDEAYLIDVNPRFFGSWAAAQAAGCPLLEAYAQYLRGKPNTQKMPDIVDRVQWTAPAGDGTKAQTARTSVRTLKEFGQFTGRRAYLAGVPSVLRAIRSAGR